MDTTDKPQGTVVNALLMCLAACVVSGLGIATGLALLVLAMTAI